MNVILIC